MNKYYTYLCPKSDLSKKDLKRLKTGTIQISEVKMIHIMKEKFDNYVRDKIMSVPQYNEILEELKNPAAELNTPHDLYIPDGDFSVSLFVAPDEQGNRTIRMSIPYDAFERKRIKADIVRTIPLNKTFNF